MSTLKLGTIATQDGTESTEVTNVVNGTAKAWVNFNGQNTVAIRRGFNVSSITDNGTGDYTVNFATAMPDTNYIISANSTSDNGGWTGQANVQPKADVTRSTSATRIVTSNSVSAGLTDHSLVNVAVFS